MKLFLTSAGLIPETRSYFMKMLGRDFGGLKVSVIPTAGDPEEDKWFIKASYDELEEMGCDITTVDLKEDPGQVKQKLEDSEVIYICGGNTFYLLDWVRKSGLDKYLGDLLEQGKVYVGVSAGSILVGPDISISGWDSAWDKNVVNLTDLRGLNFVPFAISPHFTEAERKILEEHKPKVGYEVIPLTDTQAAEVIDDRWEVVGTGVKITLIS